MTHLFDDPEVFASAALQGFCDIHARLVRPTPGGVLRATATERGKVALVIGGGSGHYPAFAGYVGPGLADGAVAGDVFASPSTRLVHDVAAKAHRGGGVILGYGNYAGDVLNFGAAAERLRSAGIDARTLAITDDIASASADELAKRRGVAGDVAVFKIAGAAAEAGLPIDEVERVARRANDRTRSFGVAFGGCTLPGADGPLFTVPDGTMAIGLGIHGEPGISESPILPAAALAALLVDRLVQEAPSDSNARVAVILNGLGSTKQEELFVLWTSVADKLHAHGLVPVSPLVGEYVTSLDMEGCSLTLTWLDDELEAFWRAPCDTAVLTVGQIRSEPAAADEQTAEEAAAPITAGAPESQADGQRIAIGFARLADALKEAEAELGRIDAQAGDGDHGQGMARGSGAGAAAARQAADAGAGAATVLASAANAWADRAGGTSGAIWGLGLLAASQALSDQQTVDSAAVGRAAEQALNSVLTLGRARPGDKTLVDAFLPFVEALNAALADGQSATSAWAAGVAAAAQGAEQTKQLIPRLGRARPLAERSLGHPDAGAVSFALCSRVVLEFMGETDV
ncbi:dihydroxyacetone kinase family protein [Acidisoma cellulosilytica]|uniref:Dihydroxyacetone kinase family protein n=1 Tax=Acidisoma cellulosilyticum TaxID=2802395 RepID=A0A964E426_9PROT|nr:dihydroxyacetone kinase family protein [Acidisoma cellulosilyticum]MCB8880533.1 dihydroxyacetone kinase family protein [Acidisoma cellulosilyticum]